MTHDLHLVIGNKNLSSWSMRPWFLMKQAGIPFREEVRLFETDGWRDTIGEVSPSRRVPALVDGEVTVWESLAICEYVAELFPEKRLWPEALGARAHARSVSAEMHAGFADMRRDLSMDVAARIPRRTLATETERDVRRVQAIWSDCRTRYAAGGPFLFGALSIADAMFAPVVWRFRGYDVAIDEPLARAYSDAMLALPTMRAWERDAIDEVGLLRERTDRAATPSPTSARHVYAVIFSSQRRASSAEEYARTAEAMDELAKKQPGYLGIESARGTDGFGITVSYWESLEAIRAWKANAAHAQAQSDGRERFYERYEIRVASVERGYKFPLS